MGSKVELTYFLPVTRIRWRAVVTTTTDTVLHTTVQQCDGLDLELLVLADRTRERTLSVEGGVWRDYSFQVALTEDGRLTEAGVESAGQVVRSLGGAAAAAVGVAALVTGNLPVAIAAGAAAGAVQMKGGPGKPTRGPGQDGQDHEAAPTDPVTDAYRAAHPGPAQRLADVVAERAGALTALRQARAAYLVAVSDPEERLRTRGAYRSCREILRDVDDDLTEARAHFAAWRRGTLTETTELLDTISTVEELPTYRPTSGLTFPGDANHPLRSFFDKAKVGLALDGTDPATVETRSDDVGNTATDALHVLRPRPITMVTVTGDSPEQVRVTAVHRELVMDKACEELHVPVRKSWNAKRRTRMGLSDLGALTELELNGTSAAASAATATADIVPSLAASLDATSQATAAAAAISGSTGDARLAELKRLVAIQEQQLLAAGQAATSEDYARLARLRQVAEEAELEAKTRTTRSTMGA